MLQVPAPKPAPDPALVCRRVPPIVHSRLPEYPQQIQRYWCRLRLVTSLFAVLPPVVVCFLMLKREVPQMVKQVRPLVKKPVVPKPEKQYQQPASPPK